jgi:hypothetical protein
LNWIPVQIVETTMPDFIDLNADQRRETINTQQRFSAWREASARAKGYRGSMVWSDVKGRDYLIRAAYGKQGLRKQTSLGARNEETEKLKAEFDHGRMMAEERLAEITTVLQRQSAVNRALGLGRVPQIGARIIRALDAAGLLGNGLRVLGTYSLFAYEAAAGVWVDSGLTTTEDIDLLLDARHGVSFAASDTIEETSLLALLQRVDRSFERSRQTFRAVNRDGYLVDLIKPIRNPPWTPEQGRVGGEEDLDAAEIEGLAWQESAPPFEAVCIDDRGQPLRIITSDPRVWTVHKLWLSERPDRAPIKRRRDAEQARAAMALVREHMPHLVFDAGELRMLPKELVERAARQLAALANPS